MKIVIPGSSGMLGRYLCEHLREKHEIVSLDRKNIDLTDCSKEISVYFRSLLSEGDVIINAAGVTKHREYNLKDMVSVNGLLPHVLNEVKKQTGCEVIHITTDCVYSGKDGGYNERSLHDCVDDYGKSKSLGENPGNTNIRTSIIGEDQKNSRSLLEWVRSNKGRLVMGYTNHIWNGITCLQLSKFIDEMIDKKEFWEGTRHIFSPRAVSKHELVNVINEIYGLGITVEAYETPTRCHRDLKSVYGCSIEKDINLQIEEQRNFGVKR